MNKLSPLGISFQHVQFLFLFFNITSAIVLLIPMDQELVYETRYFEVLGT